MVNALPRGWDHGGFPRKYSGYHLRANCAFTRDYSCSFRPNQRPVAVGVGGDRRGAACLASYHWGTSCQPNCLIGARAPCHKAVCGDHPRPPETRGCTAARGPITNSALRRRHERHNKAWCALVRREAQLSRRRCAFTRMS